ncbi:glutamate racemase [Chitinasiproducens palmae]|uniref:Glutamate racemase n=1 Tax=Chitinasiproducens palmae TaxID=1770053 RepID=A0A1H2PQG2_9BURK|nr:glutamate racemase [Chitinasiproducens palmae]SDV49036.1 glutamate racemase [Chitinasiproducens palmae]
MQPLPADPTGPVGVFDSGVGGLSVLRAIRAAMPCESLLYLADSYYAPYGQRSDAFIASRSAALADWLIGKGAKAIVVACNTATAQTIESLRGRLALPVIGVEPGVKPAMALSQTGRVGVLATAATLRSERFQTLLGRFAAGCRFVCAPGTGLVEAIEAGVTEGAAMDDLLAACLAPMREAGVDTIVLGCTHYPFIRDAIQAQVGDGVQLIDTGAAVAQQLARRLAQTRLAAPSGAAAPLRLVSTSDGATLGRIAGALLRLDSTVEHVDIPLTESTASVD